MLDPDGRRFGDAGRDHAAAFIASPDAGYRIDIRDERITLRGPRIGSFSSSLGR
jgi:hypothetical protein